MEVSNEGFSDVAFAGIREKSLHNSSPSKRQMGLGNSMVAIGYSEGTGFSMCMPYGVWTGGSGILSGAGASSVQLMLLFIS
ncbi:hypothetical protein BJY04DRAFT_189613 [Aspergillus karnatakaensis]|uniref:uncharacterized protein n=1 Tax=Aspergillus karnatakaensis TaxID=1810916 RepID=UPI003CCD7832